MSVWNLRRGDYDDNRMSPHGRGLRSLIVSALLEFNYLKAPIAFLTLIVAPALLVGIAPSLLVTYGRLMFHASAFHGGRPILTVFLWAILVAVALWIGRPLLGWALDNFWHLHYTLVFPMFVALRELLRALLERLLNDSNHPKRHEMGRPAGTILAAILILGGALALVILVEFSFGLQLVDVRTARLWPVARAALANAAVVLGVSTAIASLYWIWRELSLKGPVRDWVPNSSSDLPTNARLAQLSDLHVVGERYGYRMEKGTHGPRGNGCIRRALLQLKAIHAISPLDRVVVTGDITDAGTRAEWAEFIDLLRGCPELRRCLSFVPGNHDVNIIDRVNPGALDLPWAAGPSLRKLRFVLALDAIQGDRTLLVDPACGALGPSLREYLQERDRTDLLRALAQRGTMRGRREMTKVWNAIFPLVEPPRAGGGYGVILLDSNARSHFSLTNAIGVVTPPQLKALKLVLRTYHHNAWIILLHHQVVEYPNTSISLRDRIGLALINAPEVLAALAPHASRILLLHGHRHWDWVGTFENVAVCSVASVSLGSIGEQECRGSFHVHELAISAGGGLRLNSTQRVKLP